jgi:pimeloyl-ACP methyl ester carboxylesterase
LKDMKSKIIHMPLLIIFFLPFILGACTNLFFQPSRDFAPTRFPDNIRVEDVRIKGTKNMLHGWLISPRNMECKGFILFFHGNAENISTHSNAVAWLAPHGYCILTADYQGYGKSEGKTDIDTIHADAAIMLQQALSYSGSMGAPLIIFGQSIGGAIAIYAVATSPQKSKIAALVIEGTFMSYRDIAREKFGEHALTWLFQPLVPLLITDRYSPERWVQEVYPVRLLIMHGVDDKIVPLRHGEMIFEKARDPKQIWRIAHSGHTAAFNNSEIRRKFLEYLSTLVN